MKTNTRQNLILVLLVAAAGIITPHFLSFPYSPANSKNKKTTAKQYPVFLFLSDIHLDTETDSTVYGEDTGLDLWTAFLAKADSVLSGPNSPKFIVYTGDLPAHYSCNSGCYLPDSSRGTHNKNIATILSGLRKLAGKHHTPFFYVPGNNDGLAGDYYSFADEKQQTPLALAPGNNSYPALNINSGNNHPPCMVSNPHPTMGYYAVKPEAGLRLLALNTVMFNHNFQAVDGTNQLADATTQLSWLASQLEEAKSNNEKVYLAMHVPPGLDAYSSKSMWVQKQSWLNDFLTLATQYQETIAGILYGHTHMDEVRRLYDSSGTYITEVAISCPGVTPQHDNNPGFKTVQYDAASKEPMDFTTYYTPLGQKTWGSASYAFSSVYGAADSISINQRLRVMTLTEVTNCMNNIFTVKNGTPGYNTQTGIEVKWGE